MLGSRPAGTPKHRRSIMKIASRTYLKTFALGISVFVALQTAAFAQAKAAKIEQLMSLYDKYGQFNGAVLVADNGQVISKKGFGLANMEWSIPNTPGTKFVYSNSGYFLLGAIIEKVTGKPYEQVLKENIFDPLGMKDSGYDHWETILSKRAIGYTQTPRGYETAPYLDMSIPYAAGSLYSTVEDLYLWDQALYGEKILSAKSKELMFKPNLNNYGYGFVMTKATLAPPTKLAVPVIQHNGGINGFSTTIVRMVDDKRLIVLLDNAEPHEHSLRSTLRVSETIDC